MNRELNKDGVMRLCGVVLRQTCMDYKRRKGSNKSTKNIERFLYRGWISTILDDNFIDYILEKSLSNEFNRTRFCIKGDK